MTRLLFLFVFLFNFCSNILANPNINVRTGILMDYHSEEILYELDPDSQIYPASMTKIMT